MVASLNGALHIAKAPLFAALGKYERKSVRTTSGAHARIFLTAWQKLAQLLSIWLMLPLEYGVFVAQTTAFYLTQTFFGYLTRT